jgi:uncharacterized protein (DUF2141 family)
MSNESMHVPVRNEPGLKNQSGALCRAKFDSTDDFHQKAKMFVVRNVDMRE